MARDKQNRDLIGQLVSRGVGLMECLRSGLDFMFFFVWVAAYTTHA